MKETQTSQPVAAAIRIICITTIAVCSLLWQLDGTRAAIRNYEEDEYKTADFDSNQCRAAVKLRPGQKTRLAPPCAA